MTLFQRLNRWPIFSFLDREFLASVKMAEVLTDDLAVVVTKDKKVYTVGADNGGCLGLEPSKTTPMLKRMDDSNVVQIAADPALTFILLLSDNGSVYAFGANNYGQLGNNSTNTSTSLVASAGGIVDQRVRQVVCGSNYAAAVTEDGRVFTWGYNAYGGTGHGLTQGCTMEPTQVSEMSTHKVVKIATTVYSILCLTDRGQIYCWGQNTSGELGIGNTTTNHNRPVLVGPLAEYFIEDIQSGYQYTLALSNNGRLYAWGYNGYGQLGTGDTKSRAKPVKVVIGANEANHIPLVAISAKPGSHTSCAMSIYGDYYVWGIVNGKILCRPTKTTLTSFNSISAVLADKKITRVPLHDNDPSSVQDDLAHAFNDKTTSDLIIRVEDEEIYVHKAVLKIRSQYFRKKFQSEWTDTTTQADVIQFQYGVYHAFLRYFYTGKLENITAHDAMYLMSLAHAAEENNLVRLCQITILRTLTLQNVAYVFSQAVSLEQRYMADYCVRYATRDIGTVVESEAFKKIPDAHVRLFVEAAARHGVFIKEK